MFVRSEALAAPINGVEPEPVEPLEVAIRYRLPESVMNGVVAGGGFEPPTFGS
jgi:hypothetical protein